MPVHSDQIQLSTRGFTDIRDVTDEVTRVLAESKIDRGVCVVFVPGSTGGLTTIEYESGAVADLRAAIERIAPEGMRYDHDARWGDGNGFSHVRAALMGPSVAVPVESGRLRLGTWQQIVFIDFDNRPRDRELIVQIVGE